MSARRRTVGTVTLLAALLGVTGIAPAQAAAPASAPAASRDAESASATEQGLVTRLAGERDRAGVRALTVAPDLVEVARRHSAEMARRGEVFHDPSMRDDVQGWELLGENVGAGPDAAALHEAFSTSAAPRQTMLDPRWTQVGVGAVRAADGAVYVTQVYRLPSSGTAATGTPTPAASPARAGGPGTTAPRASTRPTTAASPAPSAAAPARATTSSEIVATPASGTTSTTSTPAEVEPGSLAARLAALRAAGTGPVATTDPVARALAFAARMRLLEP